MKEDTFKRKRRVRKLTKSKITLVFLFIIFLLLLRAVWGVYMKNMESKQNLTALEDDIALLETRNNTLKNDIQYLQTERGKEEEIRNKYNVKREGEEVIILVERSEGDNSEEKWKIWNSIKEAVLFFLR